MDDLLEAGDQSVFEPDELSFEDLGLEGSPEDWEIVASGNSKIVVWLKVFFRLLKEKLRV